MRSTIFAAILAIAQSSLAAPQTRAQQIFKFDDGTFIENLIVRANGHLILDTFNNGTIYGLDPQAKEPKAETLGVVPGVNFVSGIAEIAPDVYAVSGGQFADDLFSLREGTGRIATLNLNKKPAEIRIAAYVNNTRMLNGMASVPGNRHIVLSADSIDGRIFRTDTKTGHVDVVFKDERLTPGSGPASTPLGVNGVEVFESYLYMSNSARKWFGRIKIDKKGNTTGDLEFIHQVPADGTNTFDDFSIDKFGNAYIGYQQDALAKVTPAGKLSTLLDKNSTLKVNIPTSTALSRDGRTLFVGTGGNFIGGGQVVAVKLW